MLPLSLGGKHSSQFTDHLRVVTELGYLESHTFIQQMACSSDGMQSKTHNQKMLMAKSFLQELIQLLPRRIPQCTHLVVMNNWAQMEEPDNILEVIEPASMNACNVAQYKLESLTKFLQDERKRFVRKVRKHVSKVHMSQIREWQFGWTVEQRNQAISNECKQMLAYQRSIDGFSPKENLKRFKHFGHSSCNLTLEQAMPRPKGTTKEFIHNHLTEARKRVLESQYSMLSEIDSDLKSQGITSVGT